MRAPLMPAASTSRLKSNCRKFSTCCRVRNAMGTLADWPVEVSTFTKYGYSGCCASTLMQNTSIESRERMAGESPAFKQNGSGGKANLPQVGARTYQQFRFRFLSYFA